MTTTSPRVALLSGGISNERDVSRWSCEGIARVLREQGYPLSIIDVGQDIASTIASLRAARPDVVFNGLHGRFGEDGAIQGVLEWLGLPYTHSGVLASALAMDKVASRRILAAAGLPIARGATVGIAELADADPMDVPYVIKPINEGSSVGVEIVREGSNRRVQIASEWRFGPEALVEEFVPGRELTVAVLGDRALTVTEILPAGDHFYDFEAKYQAGGSAHRVPADIHPDAFAQALSLAVEAHRALGCAGASRTDFRYDDTAGDGPGRLVILEVNTQPGMTETSLLPEQAQFCGMSYGELCAWIVDDALARAAPGKGAGAA